MLTRAADMTSIAEIEDSPPATREKADLQNSEDIPREGYTEDSERDVGVTQEKTPKAATQDDKSPSMAKLFVISISMWLAVFLVTLDQTIVANAIPSITDEFKRLSDVGWYGSGYFLTMAAFQLFYGRVYSTFSIKYTFLAAVSLFELGSLICGVAPSSAALIVGRAVAGLGGAGLASGSMIIIAHTAPPRLRPVLTGSMGAVYAVSSVLGPLLGGLFTTHVTWRWCFYINLPLGGVTVLAILTLLPTLEPPGLESLTWREKVARIDIVGVLILIPAVVCLLLALQWGGSTYAWSDGRIIALLVLFGAIGLVFLGFEYWQGDKATLPIRMLARRSVAAAVWNAFCNGAAFLMLTYYIPFWHQVIRGVSAVDAGIDLLPYSIGVVIMAMSSGALVSKFGFCMSQVLILFSCRAIRHKTHHSDRLSVNVMMILSSIITPVGEGLLTTWTVNTSFSKWVGYQALTGMGIGMGQQQPIIAVQAILPKAEIASGTSIVMLTQTLSGTIFISLGPAVLHNELLRSLEAKISSGSSSGFNVSSLSNIGATEVRSAVPAQYLETVLVAYNGALTKVFTVALCMSALTIIGSLTMEWKNVKKSK
ncbi:major facilitator superfamily domain-containing protein [Xylariales sp. PMI_506]|nr:major facilitator superfamily domain-containing protein [Xylariales sp. PMI_506]